MHDQLGKTRAVQLWEIYESPQYAIDAKGDLCTRFLRRLGRPRLRRREPPRLLLFSPIRGPDLLDLGVGF